MRKTIYAVGEYYHIYNRGTEKRDIFGDYCDLNRFFESLIQFNTIKPIGSIFENRYMKLGNPIPKLVNIVAYCLNPNHYHLILEPCVENGIQKFMQKVGIGYTNYFNEKYKRSGALFQGKYKAIHIDSNEYLLHLSTYVNLNAKIHGYNKNTITTSSYEEYKNQDNKTILCKKEIILEQFSTIESYIAFATSTAQETFTKREMDRLET